MSNQGRPSSQCHCAMALVVFLPRPEIWGIFWVSSNKNLKAPKWHWLILDPMGALEHREYKRSINNKHVIDVRLDWFVWKINLIQKNPDIHAFLYNLLSLKLYYWVSSDFEIWPLKPQKAFSIFFFSPLLIRFYV